MAFENSNCRQYITEKYAFNALECASFRTFFYFWKAGVLSHLEQSIRFQKLLPNPRTISVNFKLKRINPIVQFSYIWFQLKWRLLNFGSWDALGGRLRRAPGEFAGRRRIFENLQKLLKKIPKVHCFSIFFKRFKNQCVNFSRVWTRNTNSWEIFAENSIEKLFPSIFGKVAKNRAFENNIIFLQHFFTFRGVPWPRSKRLWIRQCIKYQYTYAGIMLIWLFKSKRHPFLKCQKFGYTWRKSMEYGRMALQLEIFEIECKTFAKFE